MSETFNLPSGTPIASDFASAQSFRGRVVLIEVTAYETNIPNPMNPGTFQDRATARVTTLDGVGPVQIYSQKAPTGKFLDGPVHEGVWFGQDRIRKVIAPAGAGSVGNSVLAVVDTYKPGQMPGKGNPWGLVDPTPDQIKKATEIYAAMKVGGAASPSSQPVADDPFAV